ncbi:hypothetical protein [Dyadobacter fanqingshengii]|uniref:Uncharacterized protein n=1 Tax=Dyadobacter fanqingshengii TaxID=2906443 RepID=A0A9X1THB1_9BACT|nr:hypothetical protein [Dyadobacter fanqingshengii]MCF0041452.1 hypothetical protein [Dyadobacter fanqingshengii]MCF2505443.1 hypothetical protein [Dyadobacter fanqingshengii]USJ36829.1 hypothetical protein NFI81_03440 [Dyadobacter fanqingshengii]
MGKTTNFETWLSDVALEGKEDVYDLYNSISNFEQSGKFYTSKEVTNDGYEYLVKADGNEDSLHLESDEIKFSFINHLRANYTDADESNIDVWYDLKKELGRID